MPVKSKPHIAAYHQTDLRSFCNSYEETVFYLFLTDAKLNSVWNFVFHLLFKLTGYAISMITSIFFLVVNFWYLNISFCQKQIDTIVFFIKYFEAFQSHRNQIIHKGIAFNSDCIIKKIASMIISGHHAKNYRKKQKYNVSIKALCNSLNS